MKNNNEKEFLIICSPLAWGGGVFTMIKTFYEMLSLLGYKPLLVYPDYLPHKKLMLEIMQMNKLFNNKHEVRYGMNSILIPQLPFVDWNKKTSIQYKWFGYKIRNLIKKYHMTASISGTAQVALQLEKSKKAYFCWIGSSHEEELRAKIKSPLGDKPAEKLLESSEWKKISAQERQSLLGARKIVTLSDYHKQCIINILPHVANRLITIPMPIDTRIFNSKERKKNMPKYKKIIYTGRINDPRKNINLLIESFSTLLKNNSREIKYELILVGEMPRSELVNHVSNMGIRENVTFIDHLNPEKLSKVYKNADLFVSTSIQEPLGLSVLEALACGTPVITTKSGGPDEMIRKSKAGIIIHTNKPREISRAIEKLLNDERKWKEFSRLGANYVKNELNFQKISKKVQELINLVFVESIS